MPRVATATKPVPIPVASTLRCAECGSADVVKARRFPATAAVGSTFVCPACAAISVIDRDKARMLRTHEWAPIVLEPFGFELLELRLSTANKLRPA